MTRFQPGIAAPVPKHARFVAYRCVPGYDPRKLLAEPAPPVDGSTIVRGLGATLFACPPMNAKGLDLSTVL